MSRHYISLVDPHSLAVLTAILATQARQAGGEIRFRGIVDADTSVEVYYDESTMEYVVRASPPAQGD